MTATQSNREDSGVSIHKGFPNPATDNTLTGLDLHTLLVKHPASTFFMQIEGNQWEEQGIQDGDILLVDRALEPKKTDYVIWWDEADFVISRLSQMPEGTILWGIVSAAIHRYRA